MSAKRVKLARALDRVGLLRTVLEARARAIFPWRWLTVLTFHRVSDQTGPGFDPEVVDTSPERFDRQIALLKRYFTFVDTRDLEAFRQGAQPLPANPVMVTFDDGYRDNHDVALPILKRHGAKAVFFVASRFVDERRLYWWEQVAYVMDRSRGDRLRITYPEPRELSLLTAADRRLTRRTLCRLIKDTPGLDLDRFLAELQAAAGVTLEDERALADQLIMTWDHVRALHAAGMDVQAHGHAHRVLQTLTLDEVTADLARARELIGGHLNKEVRAVAYPAGSPVSSTPGLVDAIARSGMTLGFSNGTGAANLDSALTWLDVPRVSTDLEMPEEFFRGCLAIPALAY
jgi:peptidoglycan/xylan/chitin deacetylase (PgdA/CDA1 family)